MELFYDFVYVIVIAQAAHHRAGHVAGRGVLELAIVCGLIWIAWLNGTLYFDLHGREDWRTRSLVFVQMATLALLAVLADDCGIDGCYVERRLSARAWRQWEEAILAHVARHASRVALPASDQYDASP